MLMTTVAYADDVAFKGNVTFFSDAPVEKINGTASATGSLTLNGKALESTKGTFSVPVASMKTGNDIRDEHLQGAEWLNAKKCPNVTFEFAAAKVLKTATKKDVTIALLEVSGDFSVNCNKKPLTTKVELKWKGQKYKANTSFNIALADFNVAGKKGIVGNKVGKQIAVKVSFQGKGK
jgi:polyisoprenoid-binding protein YceI